MLRRRPGLFTVDRKGHPAPAPGVREQAHLLPAGEDDGATDLHVADLDRPVLANQDGTCSPRSRETRDRLSVGVRACEVSLGSAHAVHEAQTYRETRVGGTVDSELSPVLDHRAFDGVFILFVRTKGGAVGRVEWLDSDKGKRRCTVHGRSTGSGFRPESLSNP